MPVYCNISCQNLGRDFQLKAGIRMRLAEPPISISFYHFEGPKET